MEKLSKPAWVKINEEELKKIILELSSKNSPSQIGFILRDQYGIPTTKIFGKKLKKYLEEAGVKREEEFESAQKKVNSIKEHLKKNNLDKKAKHKSQKAQSKLNTVQRYLKISRS